MPRKLKQYQAVNLAEPGVIEMLLTSLSSALNRKLIADPEAVERLRNELIGHLGTEGASNHDFVDRFMRTEEISFQDSMGIIERIANSSDPSRLAILLKLRTADFLSYPEQTALDIAIGNVKAGNRTENIQKTVSDNELGRTAQMVISGNAEATQLAQINKYVRYVSRKGTQPYKMAKDKIRDLLAGRDNGLPANDFRLEIALNLGFRCAQASRSKEMEVFDDVPDINLAKVGLTRTALICTGAPREWLDGIKATLKEEGREAALWFSVGFWCYGVTWVLVEKRENLKLELGGLIATEDGQRLLREDGEVSRALSNFLGAMTDAGWSPDNAEKFLLEKIMPFLWDRGHRKWAHRQEMGPMQDLAFQARKIEVETQQILELR